MSQFDIPPVPANLAMRYTQRLSNMPEMEHALDSPRDGQSHCQSSISQLRPNCQNSPGSGRLTVPAIDNSNITRHQNYRGYRVPRSASVLAQARNDRPGGSQPREPDHTLSRPNSMVSLSTQLSSESQHSQRCARGAHFSAEDLVDPIGQRPMKSTKYAQSSPFLLTGEEERHNDANAAIPGWLDLPQRPRKLVKSPRNPVRF